MAKQFIRLSESLNIELNENEMPALEMVDFVVANDGGRICVPVAKHSG
jgi:hypothetical protein